MRNTHTNIVALPVNIAELREGYTKPVFVDLHTSNICNQFCEGCPYTHKHDKQFMSELDHFYAVDAFMDFGVMAFDFAGGGEPTTLPYLAKLMRHIQKRGGYFGLITNGVVLPDDVKQVMLESGTYARFSLEASDPENYARYKKHGGWERVAKNISDLVELQEKRKSDLQIGIKFAVGKTLRGKEHYLRGLIYGMKHGADRITFKALTHEPEELTQEELKIEAEILQQLLGSDARLRAITSYWLEQLPDEDIAQCWLNQMHTVMDYKGDLYICCYYYIHGESHKIGNIFRDDLGSIWLNDRHKAKVARIDREICKKVYCKFFHHHLALREIETRGRGYFL